MKSVHFASLLLIGAALGLWAFQHAVPAEKAASAITRAMAR
jgi:hypothetical protein